MLSHAPCGPGTVVGHAEEMLEIGDEHASPTIPFADGTEDSGHRAGQCSTNRWSASVAGVASPVARTSMSRPRMTAMPSRMSVCAGSQAEVGCGVDACLEPRFDNRLEKSFGSWASVERVGSTSKNTRTN